MWDWQVDEAPKAGVADLQHQQLCGTGRSTKRRKLVYSSASPQVDLMFLQSAVAACFVQCVLRVVYCANPCWSPAHPHSCGWCSGLAWK